MIKEVLLGATGVVVGAAIIAIVKYQITNKENSNVERVFFDELNMGEVKNWFKGKLVDENQKGVIFYPTKKNAEQWKVKICENKNQLIQIVYDVKEDKVVAYREIIFTELNEKFRSLLDGNGGTLVVDK